MSLSEFLKKLSTISSEPNVDILVKRAVTEYNLNKMRAEILKHELKDFKVTDADIDREIKKSIEREYQEVLKKVIALHQQLKSIKQLLEEVEL